MLLLICHLSYLKRLVKAKSGGNDGIFILSAAYRLLSIAPESSQLQLSRIEVPGFLPVWEIHYGSCCNRLPLGAAPLQPRNTARVGKNHLENSAQFPLRFSFSRRVTHSHCEWGHTCRWNKSSSCFCCRCISAAHSRKVLLGGEHLSDHTDFSGNRAFIERIQHKVD